jgi:hypothetical protein
MVLARELEHRRVKLGYDELWQAYYAEHRAGQRPSWEVYCSREAGVSLTTKRNYLQAFEEALERLRTAGSEDARALLALMEQVPSALTAEQRQHMIAEIARMFPDESMLSLRAAYRARTAPQALEVQPDAPVKADSPPPVIEATATPASIPHLSANAHKMWAMAMKCGVAPERALRIELIVEEQENKDMARLARNNLAKLALREFIQGTNGHHQS